MIAVFKREFAGLFRRLYGYIIVSVLIVASAAAFIAYNLTYTDESIVNVLSFMTIISALVAPVLANAMYPSRKKTDTDVIYGAMPLSVRDIVVGKYLAALAALMLPNILTALYPTVAGMLGQVDHAVSYSALLGFIFFEAAVLSVCMYIAKTAKSRLRAYIYSYILIVLWYFADIVNVLIPTTPLASLVGFALVVLIVAIPLYMCTKKLVFTAAVSGVLLLSLAAAFLLFKESFAGLCEKFIDTLSIFGQYRIFTYGLFNLEGIIYFSLLILLFIFFTWRNFSRKYQKREIFYCFGVKSAVSVVLALVLAVSSFAVTCTAAILPDRFSTYDATLAGKNSVSEQAKEFLAGIDKPVTIYLLEPTGFEDYELYLESLAACNESITLKTVFNSNTPEFYTDRGINTDDITANSLYVECGDRGEYISYLSLFYYSNEVLGASQMTVSERQYYYQIFSSSTQYAENLQSLRYDTETYFNADKEICSCIEYITTDIIPANYYLVGNGEKSVNDTDNLYYGYDYYIEIDVEASDIPADAASILINMPTEDISDNERQKLSAYLARGGQLTFVTDTQHLSMTNICALLAEYGMSATDMQIKQVVEETDEETDETTETVTTDISTKVHTDNDILYYLDSANLSIKLKNPNAITVDTSKVENLIQIPIVSSTNKAYMGDDQTKTSTFTLACAVETPSGAKLAWFTSGESFNDADSDAAVLAIYTSVLWTTLKYQTKLEGVPAALYSPATTIVSSGSVTMLKVVLVLIPIAIATTGAILFYRRKKAK